VGWVDRTTPAQVRAFAQLIGANGQASPSWPRGGAMLSRRPTDELSLSPGADGTVAAVLRDAETFQKDDALSNAVPNLESPDAPTPIATTFLGPRPNPAREVIAFAFSLAERQRVSITIFDMAGRRIATPLRDVLDPGPHQITWNRHSGTGQALQSISLDSTVPLSTRPSPLHPPLILRCSMSSRFWRRFRSRC
jgi:hypothetical protein